MKGEFHWKALCLIVYSLINILENITFFSNESVCNCVPKHYTDFWPTFSILLRVLK